MRNALLFSVVLHVAAGVLSQAVVKFSRVRFVPREVYSVQLVDPAQFQKPSPQKAPTPVVEKKVEPPKQVKEEKPEDLVPPEKKRPQKKTPKEVKKTVQQEKISETTPQSLEDDAPPEPATGDMQLSVEDFPFAYYLTSIKRKIAALWKVPGTSASEERFCRVYFQVGRSGTVGGLAVETSSGNFLFDQSALRAVTLASPLPPLPNGFTDSYLGVHFSFAYEEEY